MVLVSEKPATERQLPELFLKKALHTIHGARSRRQRHGKGETDDAKTLTRSTFEVDTLPLK